VLVALAGIAITYRGRKFFAPTFCMVLLIDVIVSITFTDHVTVPEIWQIGVVGATVFGLISQIVMAILFKTVTRTCPHCGHVLQRPEHN